MEIKKIRETDDLIEIKIYGLPIVDEVTWKFREVMMALKKLYPSVVDTSGLSECGFKVDYSVSGTTEEMKKLMEVIDSVRGDYV